MIMPEQFIMSNHLPKLTQTPGGLRNNNENQPDTGQKPDSQHGTRDMTPNSASGSKLCWTPNKNNTTQFSSQSERFAKIETQQGNMCNQLYTDSDYSDSTSANIRFSRNSDDDKTNKPVGSENAHKSRLKPPSGNSFRKPGEIFSLLPLHHKLTARCQQSLQSRKSGSSGSHSLSSGYQSGTGSDSTEWSMNVPSHIQLQCMIRPPFGQQKQTVSNVSCSKTGQEQSSSDQNIQTQEKRKRFLRTRDALKKSGLLEITMKTAELMKKNQILNAELAGLKRKADEYMTSLLENPQNKEFAEIYFLEREKRMKQDLNQQNTS